eukprot:jgi/Mesvir1/19049/Mv12811-RA.2
MLSRRRRDEPARYGASTWLVGLTILVFALTSSSMFYLRGLRTSHIAPTSGLGGAFHSELLASAGHAATSTLANLPEVTHILSTNYPPDTGTRVAEADAPEKMANAARSDQGYSDHGHSDHGHSDQGYAVEPWVGTFPPSPASPMAPQRRTAGSEFEALKASAALLPSRVQETTVRAAGIMLPGAKADGISRGALAQLSGGPWRVAPGQGTLAGPVLSNQGSASMPRSEQVSSAGPWSLPDPSPLLRNNHHRGVSSSSSSSTTTAATTTSNPKTSVHGRKANTISTMKTIGSSSSSSSSSRIDATGRPRLSTAGAKCSTSTDCGTVPSVGLRMACVQGACRCPVLYSGGPPPSCAPVEPAEAWCLVPLTDALFNNQSRRDHQPLIFLDQSEAASSSPSPRGRLAASSGRPSSVPADLPQMADFSTCAVVGSGASLLSTRHGAAIDAHSVVIRFNDAPTKGLEDRVGSKTTLRLQNLDYCGFRESDREITIQYTRNQFGACGATHILHMSRLLLSYSRLYFRKVQPTTRDVHGGRLKMSGGFFGLALALHLCGQAGITKPWKDRHNWKMEAKCRRLMADTYSGVTFWP